MAHDILFSERPNIGIMTKTLSPEEIEAIFKKKVIFTHKQRPPDMRVDIFKNYIITWEHNGERHSFANRNPEMVLLLWNEFSFCYSFAIHRFGESLNTSSPQWLDEVISQSRQS